jgi:hypothetical protein
MNSRQAAFRNSRKPAPRPALNSGFDKDAHAPDQRARIATASRDRNIHTAQVGQTAAHVAKATARQASTALTALRTGAEIITAPQGDRTAHNDPAEGRRASDYGMEPERAHPAFPPAGSFDDLSLPYLMMCSFLYSMIQSKSSPTMRTSSLSKYSSG